MIEMPTHTDVLLGRGVAANRHPGNENFRAIVSQHVEVYVISAKKQKTMISRSIIDKVHTELNPPGRFLAKNVKTGLWHEVDDKRALEKTAQALRDGAAPLRKQLSEDMSDPTFLDALFDGGDACGSNKSLSILQKTKKGKKRMKTSPPMADAAPSSVIQSRKKQRSDPSRSGNFPAPVHSAQSVTPTDFTPPRFESQHQKQSLAQQPYSPHVVHFQDSRDALQQHQQVHTIGGVGLNHGINTFSRLPEADYAPNLLKPSYEDYLDDYILEALEPAHFFTNPII